jgi:hypothetical protein
MRLAAKANESLFWESASTRRAPAEDEEAEEEDDVLTKPRCEAVATFLLELGLSPASLPEIITQHPPLLAYDVEARLRPLAAYLAVVGQRPPTTHRVDQPERQQVTGQVRAGDGQLRLERVRVQAGRRAWRGGGRWGGARAAGQVRCWCGRTSAARAPSTRWRWTRRVARW